MLQQGLRLGKLNQNQFGYEEQRVIDVVMQGHVEMWQAMQERDRIYANAEATDDDYMKAAELEGKFAEVRRLRRRSACRGPFSSVPACLSRYTTDRCARWRPG